MSETTLDFNSQETKEILELLFLTPRMEWREKVEKLPDPQQYVTSLEHYAQEAVRLAEYIDQRVYGNDHEGAVKASNNRVAKVRKAMGFSIPRRDVHF